ncbi:MAG TPA: endonuclease/exonuclease/phosphatase family protein [Acetobacteraceae bacterium]|nr:endonuclease/exonuclease/phosphatase family protein [Acetobacteraceae bacterium]
MNRRLANLLAWVSTSKPDVVCLQELKCTDSAFPVEEFRGTGCDAVRRGWAAHV